jgi:hypothetical protein
MIANRVHDNHSDDLFSDLRQFIACFKDVMLEVACRSYEERSMSFAEFNALILRELTQLSD